MREPKAIVPRLRVMTCNVQKKGIWRMKGEHKYTSTQIDLLSIHPIPISLKPSRAGSPLGHYQR